MRTLLLFLTLSFPLFLAAQETRKIQGIVLESPSNEPLPGATIFLDPDAPEAKTYNPSGTVTGVDGRFTFTLPKNIKYVIVSFIGFESVKLDILGKTDFTIHLKPDTEQLDEVLVTGYQKIEKRKVTSAITKVDMNDIKSVGVAGVDQMLEGKIAGMMSTPVSGAPGAPTKIRIRSTVSLSGSTDPLWVVDGMILEGNDIPKDFSAKDNVDELYNTSIAGINPADIENITVLKDAAATAIYGARAANGVIVLTTKKGSKGKIRVNASASVFYTMKPNLDKLNLMNASEKVDFELGLAAREDLTYRSESGGVSRFLTKYNQWDAFRNGGFNAISSEAQAAINGLRKNGTNWGDQVYQNAVNQQYGFSFSGGSDMLTYYLSGGYFNEEGTTIGTEYERFNVTMKMDYNFTDRFKIGAALFVTDSKRTGYLSDSDASTNPQNYSRLVNPYLNAYDETGNYLYDPDIEGYSDRYVTFNLLEERKNTNYQLKNRSLKPMITLDYKVAPWLNLNTQYSMQIDNSGTEKMADKESYFTRKYREKTRYSKKGDNGQQVYDYFLPDGGIIQNWNTDAVQYQWKAQAEFNKRFAEKHETNVMLGMEMRGNKSTEIHTKGFGYDSKSLVTKPIIFPTGSTAADDEMFRQYKKRFNENRFLSYYMTASYTYDNRYTFFGSVRYDGSDLFGVDNKYKYLPLWAVSGAWNINREEWLSETEWLSDLKLRVSYGLQGNVDKNTSPMVVGEWNNSSIFPGINEPNINVSSPPNQYLRWEKTANWNVGVDYGMFNNRITLSVDGYYRKSSDLIAMRLLPGENGFDYTAMNWAEATNKGVEISLSTVNIKTKDFRWVMDFNISHNSSNVNKIDVRDNSFTPSLEGHPISAMFALKTAGVDDKGLPMFWKDGVKTSFYDFYQLDYGFSFGEPYVKSNLTPKQYRELFTYIGDSEPKFTGGFINKFYYKNFDLTISTGFNIGQTVREEPFYDPTKTSPGQNYSKRIMDVWSPTNPNGKYPGFLGPRTEGGETQEYNKAYQWLSSKDPATSFRNYDIWYKKISYLRVNSIRAGYSLPTEMLAKTGISALRINVEARNPFVFGTSYDGYFDPETYGSIYSQPMPRTFSVGLDLTF